jgi:thiol:disulfide interchange protein DsbD
VSVVAALGAAGASAWGEKPASGKSGGFATQAVHPVTAELITEHASVQPGGTTRIGVLFELQDGWHIYAEDPGDAGLPTKVKWSGPRGAKFGPLVWPAHQEFVDPGDIRTFGYSGAVVLSSDVRMPSGSRPGEPVRLAADVEWLACKEICLPGKTSLELALPVSGTTPSFSTHANFFDHAS